MFYKGFIVATVFVCFASALPANEAEGEVSRRQADCPDVSNCNLPCMALPASTDGGCRKCFCGLFPANFDLASLSANLQSMYQQLANLTTGQIQQLSQLFGASSQIYADLVRDSLSLSTKSTVDYNQQVIALFQKTTTQLYTLFQSASQQVVQVLQASMGNFARMFPWLNIWKEDFGVPLSHPQGLEEAGGGTSGPSVGTENDGGEKKKKKKEKKKKAKGDKSGKNKKKGERGKDRKKGKKERKERKGRKGRKKGGNNNEESGGDGR